MSTANASERAFALHELFFSCTDQRGFIRSANSVFGRVAGYTAEQYVGAPHKLVRHPDTPRIVFRLLWDHLDRGRPIAAYVKNRASDGGHYWVMALAFPAGEELLSIRLKPTSAWFAAIEPLYASLRETEDAIGAQRTRSAAIDASAAQLGEALAGLGFDSYDDFMRRALVAEVSARRAALHAQGWTTTTRAGTPSARSGRVARDTLAVCGAVADDLCAIADDLDRYERLAAELGGAASSLTALAEDVGFFALNATLSADRTGSSAEVLRTIADLMRDAARLVEHEVRTLSAHLAAATAQVRELAFSIAAAALAVEMVTTFVVELGDDADDDEHDGSAASGRAVRDIAGLVGAVQRDVASSAALLAGLDDRLQRLTSPLRRLSGHLTELRILRLRAEIEAVADPAAGQFLRIIEHVDGDLARAAQLADQLGRLVREARSADHAELARRLDVDAASLTTFAASV